MAEWVKTYKTRDEKVQEALERLDAGVVGFFQSDNFREYLKFMGRFHHYSLNNQILIAMQRPGSSLVAGYNDWQKKFKRHVMRGEKGILILAPVIKKKEEIIEGQYDKNGDPEIKMVSRIVNFATAYVYDVSQTDGEPIPDIGIHHLNPAEEVRDYNRVLSALMDITDCAVTFEKIDDGSNGFYRRSDHSIHILEGMSQAQTLKTLIHEIAHSMLHKEAMSDKPREQKEVEAESTAFIVCDYLGLDASDYSFGYVATWSSGQKPSDLKNCLSGIRTASNKLMEELDLRLGIESSREQRKAVELAKNVKEFAEASGLEPETVVIMDQGKPRRDMIMLVTNSAGSYRAEFHLRGDPEKLKRLLKSPKLTFEYLDQKLQEEGFFVDRQPVQQGHIYDFSYVYDSKQFARYPESATDSPLAVMALPNAEQEEAAFALNEGAPMIDKNRVTILPHSTAPDPISYIDGLYTYEQRGYDARWPMVSVVYSSTDKIPTKSMDIYAFQKMISKLPKSVLGSQKHFIKFRLTYVINDQPMEKVLDMDFGRGEADYLNYLKLPATTISYLKSHTSVLAMIEMAEDLADGTKAEGYGAEYADRVQEWAEYCRMELNHNSDRPVIPRPPEIDERFPIEYQNYQLKR